MGRKAINEVGNRYGKLVVQERAGSNKYNKPLWLCKCDCGGSCIALGRNLRRGQKISCGCFHGGKKTRFSKERLYAIWEGIKGRTGNPNNPKYKYYGGRGINVCSEWSDNYLSFKEWALASGYDDNARYGDCTIDRIDVDGDYCPENCRWVSIAEQNRNRRFCKNRPNPYEEVTE